nr:hypothetical protein Iba_chr12aCG2680 [Ipomoea batatas]
MGRSSASRANDLSNAFLTLINAFIMPVPTKDAPVPTANSLAPFLCRAPILCKNE